MIQQKKFKLHSAYKPSGDQPQAIKALVDGVNDGLKNQVLLGVTGSGKTFTIANVIEQINRPTLVIAHNKVLAAQLCNELREFFPENRVEYFVSYYDYYQPEAYIASTDTYIEKDMSTNEEIDKMRNSATASLLSRTDTIVVASVSCIYGLGNPEQYLALQFELFEGQQIDREQVVSRLIEMQYERSDIEKRRATFSVRGDVLDIIPASSTETGIRVQFFGDEIERISEFDVLSMKKLSDLKNYSFFPASHFSVKNEIMKNALKAIQNDKEKEVKEFQDNGKLLEAERLNQRVSYNVEMMQEIGYCSGIENYSRYFDGRLPGEPPFTLMDYFPNGYLTIIDESHMTLPQIRAMYNGDLARKGPLIDYGFRLKSAYDNRPLNFDEFNSRLGQTIYISATPAPYERALADQIAQQILRPTGLCDPEIEVLKTENQMEVLQQRIRNVVADGGKVLVTTLTKKMAEALTVFLTEHKIKARYLHSEIDTMERVDIINGLRAGEFDVIVGINLLREGLDIPEVEMVAILDADKEGFLRSEGALIQTIGRAARNSKGRVIMFADTITGSMERAISETNRRRDIQKNYNTLHNITPQTIKKDIKNSLYITKDKNSKEISKKQIPAMIEDLKGQMSVCVTNLDFESAIKIRDEISKLRKQLKG